MGICSFAKCTRSAKDGSRFPLKNKKLLQAWVKRTGRADGTFVPTEASYVCGEHFLDSDWELKDGKRKLRANVVPQPITFKKEFDTVSRKRKPNPRYPSIAESLAHRSINERHAIDEDMVEENAKLKTEIVMLKNQNERLSKMLGKVFNPDQISVLGDMVDFGNDKCRPRAWSNETVLESLKLHSMCGTLGYNYLCTKFPLPKIRTLQSQTEGVKKNKAPGGSTRG
ncbi:uncharacterized protein LOC132195077 [Neocloeon triangulifer]|uniref:uncharacterized protein LOC132195077 n=1 Tax=Neocloeon triangulifer TaxID=2078957 RepID=UPI00286EDF6C|nr:uncharacterized protein LOC132195077 [Neocloeon triangulifer]